MLRSYDSINFRYFLYKGNLECNKRMQKYDELQEFKQYGRVYICRCVEILDKKYG